MLEFFSSDTSFTTLALLIQEYQYSVAFLTPLIFGEIPLFLFGILFGSGSISLGPLFAAAAAVLLYDILIFAGVKYLQSLCSLRNFCVSFRFLEKIDSVVTRYTKEFISRPFLLLLLFKVLPMTKLTIFLYATKTSISLFSFIIKDIIATSIWVSIIFIPGVFVGKEFFSKEDGQNLITFIATIFTFLIIMTLLEKTILRSVRLFMKKKKK